MFGRRQRGVAAGGIATGTAAALLGLAAVASSATAASVNSAAQAPTSAAFAVRGSNGFSLDVESKGGVVTVVASERRPPVATFSRRGAPRPASTDNGAASIYRVRGSSPDPREIDVELGALGRISVSFHPSGRSRVTRLGGDTACVGPLRIVRRLGTFRGTVEFHGEAGYTSAVATSAPGSIGTPLPTGCAGASRAPRRTVLSAVDLVAGVRFEAATTASGTAFTATWSERLGRGMAVSRRAYAGAPRASFTFDRQLSSARVTPPAPFTGSARFADGADGEPRWTGRLRATFPGVVIPMTGPGFEVRLGAVR